jgi:hypothetical protein
VVTGVIKWELQHKLKGKTIMYMDDVCGISLRRHVKEDMECARKIVTDLLRVKSLAVQIWNQLRVSEHGRIHKGRGRGNSPDQVGCTRSRCLTKATWT